MKKFILLILIASGCSNMQTQYFPESAFHRDSDMDNFVQSWYSSHLESMKEPSLYRSNEGIVYRFTWLPTFHAPMTFRLTKPESGGYRLIVKRTNGAGGYEPGSLVDDESIELSADEAENLIQKLEKQCDFWQLPTREETFGLDGSQWVFEGRREDRYHVVDRWSPDAGCLREVGLKFMELSRVEVSEIY